MTFIEKVKIFIKVYAFDIWIVIGIFLLAAVPRLLDLGVFLTADEKNWIGRSFEFIRAFSEFRFNDMLQTTHPGVTTLWVSGLAIALKSFLGNISYSSDNLFHFIKAAQFPVILLNTLAVPAMYVLMRVLFPTRWLIALFSSLLLALDPFVVGYSRVIHVDAPLMSFLILAAISTIIYVQKGFDRTWLIVSAVLSALAILTKAPAVFMIPFFGLSVLMIQGKDIFRKQVLKARIKDFTIWLLVVLLLIVIIWPALLWVPNPEGNILLLKRDIGQAAVTPHHMVEDYTLNAWHYPAALIARTTPITLALSMLAIGWITVLSVKKLRGQDIKDFGLSLPSLQLILAYGVFFVIMMTLGAKKGDRYILPVWPAINILAALGILLTTQLVFSVLKKQFSTIAFKPVLWVLVTIVVGYHISILVFYHPYAIAYSNPIFPDNLSQELGWGEGLEQVGKWLNENDPNAVVASWYPEELAAYTTARVAHINAHEQPQVRYIVLYRNMFGRADDHPATNFIQDYYNKREPVFTAYVADKPYVWVFEKRVYERNIGEMLPQGVRIGQEFTPEHNNLDGIDILVATYNERAQEGQLIVELKDQLGGNVLYQWKVPVVELDDNSWYTLRFPEDLSIESGESLFIEVFAAGTRENNAPTVRYSSSFEYLPTPVYISKSGALTSNDEQKGSLGIRLRYLVGDTLVTEEDTRLLD